jgi:hypothetical protein
MDFYGDLSACYRQILADGKLKRAMQFFSDIYSARIPDIKILDCIFKSAGSRGLKVTCPPPSRTWMPHSDFVELVTLSDSNRSRRLRKTTTQKTEPINLTARTTLSNTQ